MQIQMAYSVILFGGFNMCNHLYCFSLTCEDSESGRVRERYVLLWLPKVSSSLKDIVLLVSAIRIPEHATQYL